MRLPFYSLRTGILTHLAFLILAAMLLINMVLLRFSEKDLIQTRVDAGHLLLQAMAQRIIHEYTQRDNTGMRLETDKNLSFEFDQTLSVGNYSGVIVIGLNGHKVLSTFNDNNKEKEALAFCRETLTTRQRSVKFHGSVWGVIWLGHEYINISSPILANKHLIGAMTLSAQLAPIYKMLRKSQKIILFYIVLNTILLVLFGFYLLSQSVIKPIHKLLRMTEKFKEGEAFPHLIESSQNEFGRLSRSLNMMMERLEENKQELKSNISSLEKANHEIRKAQEEIIKSEKMASVGRLSAGLAHEIGNPIGIVLGFVELIKRDDLTSEERSDALDRVESELTRINDIIRQLLDFSRPSSGEKHETHAHPLLEQTLAIFQHHPVMAKIDTKLNLKAKNDRIWADPNQLSQVFLNVIINATDAMEGLLRLDSNADTQSLTIETSNTGKAIQIRFIDSGPGMASDELARIFDPFYTTKEPGKGTGLGLSVCYRIIDGLNGSIHAQSRAGKGTTISIDIPLYAVK